MSRNRGSHWEPAYAPPHGDGYGRRHYVPPTGGRNFNYWRDETTVPSYRYSQRSYRRESHNEQWHDDRRSWRHESSYSRRWRDLEPGRGAESQRRDASPARGNRDRERHATHTPPPYIPRPTFRARTPVESTPQFPKPTSPDPPRTMSPPPTKPSRPPKPSSGYLSLSEEPSEELHDPGSSRKLLALDLNGTLLIRSARSRVSSGVQLRAVQPRPYMQSFRQYLFLPDTKAWLDTMVWSSAQPHSVDDMVNKVFGPTKGELKAVWDRKSLGLSEADYRVLTNVCALDQKTVTTKDLAKLWRLFASALDDPEKLTRCSAATLPSQVTHSALTTLLLDDSPHKAAFQPYNHVCIPEYDSTRRQHDLRSFLATKEPKGGRPDEKAKPKDHVNPEPSSGGSLLNMAEKEPFDVILLAVVGILEAIKLQSNVAGWIRKGGLWASQEKSGEGGGQDVLCDGVVGTENSRAGSDGVVGSGNDARSMSDLVEVPEQAGTQTKMWFDDASVIAYWVTQGRRALVELGIPIIHGVTG